MTRDATGAAIAREGVDWEAEVDKKIQHLADLSKLLAETIHKLWVAEAEIARPKALLP